MYGRYKGAKCAEKLQTSKDWGGDIAKIYPKIRKQRQNFEKGYLGAKPKLKSAKIHSWCENQAGQKLA